MNLLFLAYEFTCETFSGNGIYSGSQVRALRALGHQVRVLAACPERSWNTAGLPSVHWVSAAHVPLPHFILHVSNHTCAGMNSSREQAVHAHIVQASHAKSCT